MKQIWSTKVCQKNKKIKKESTKEKGIMILNTMNTWKKIKKFMIGWKNKKVTFCCIKDEFTKNKVY